MGQYIYRNHWTPLSLPQYVIDSVHQLANTQPRGLEFCDRNNQPMISKDDDLYDDTDVKSYEPVEDDGATDIIEVHGDKDSPPYGP